MTMMTVGAMRRGGNSAQVGPFALGEKTLFLDFSVAGRIKFVMDGITPTEVNALTIWDRILRLVESLEKYYKY